MKSQREEVRSEIANIKNLLKPDFDADFHQLLKGKTVVVVGPAETMIGTRQGELIDSYDLIVRFNTVIEYLPFTDELALDIGARTDIIYCNNEVLIDGIAGQKELPSERFTEICEKLAIRYIVCTNNAYGADPSQKDEFLAESETFKRFLQAQGIKTGFRMLFAASLLSRKLLSGHVGRTGFIALLNLLASDAKQVSVTGMTFYHKGGHLFISNRADELHPLKNHLGEMPKDNTPGHNSYLELRAMKELSNFFEKRLKLDDHLQRLLKAGSQDSD